MSKTSRDNGANRSGQRSDNLDLRIQENQLIDDQEAGNNHGFPSHHGMLSDQTKEAASEGALTSKGGADPRSPRQIERDGQKSLLGVGHDYDLQIKKQSDSSRKES